jgi:hypothetical protein
VLRQQQQAHAATLVLLLDLHFCLDRVIMHNAYSDKTPYQFMHDEPMDLWQWSRPVRSAKIQYACL